MAYWRKWDMEIPGYLKRFGLGDGYLDELYTYTV